MRGASSQAATCTASYGPPRTRVCTGVPLCTLVTCKRIMSVGEAARKQVYGGGGHTWVPLCSQRTSPERQQGLAAEPYPPPRGGNKVRTQEHRTAPATTTQTHSWPSHIPTTSVAWCVL